MTKEQGAKPETWGRFKLVSRVGTGGMGDVYKAFDPNLNRYIALKILRYEDPDVLKRFVREARAQAQVEHPHVCKIYESGECDGHPYIAMQYIDGKNLHEISAQLNLEEKLRIMKDVTLGLHAAHRQGLIHRDVKPANIMVAQTEEGQWKPYVMDFGIAREQAAPGLTATGMLVGTPFYLSPELATGKKESLDRRCDIYSLGVTLYELLSGSVPFKGDTPVDILLKVIEKDPPPLRKVNPRIPPDVETIVVKCMEKDPNRRYGSAKEVAEDIQRYLDGDPITARPVTITYRLRRKLTKHKWPAVSIGIASVLVIVLIALWLQARWAASQRAVIAQELGQEVEKIESTIHYAHLLPLHNISREKNNIRERINLIEEKMKKVGKMGLGPGHYAMGRGFMALQEYGKARDHLEKAWETGYRTPGVAYELGRALGELFLKESEKANRIDNKELREARLKEVEKTFREPAVGFLSQAGQIQDESQDYIAALISFYEKKFTKALYILQGAMKKTAEGTPWLYQAKILEGNIYLEIGRGKNNYDEAMENFSRAEQAFQQVIRIGESDVRGYIGLSQVIERKMRLLIHSRGGDVHPLVEEAVTQCQKALRIEPGKADVYVMQSSVYRWWGRHLMILGQNPLESFNQSITLAQNAIELQKENFEADTIIGITNRLKGQYQMSHGLDPTETFRTAAESFKKAIQLNPNYVMAYNGMGNVYIRKAQYEMNQGKDPDESMEQAVSTFEKALSINPDLVNLHNGLAGALWFQGGTMMARGQDPRPAFFKAIQSLKNAIKINPSFSHFYSNLGFVYMDVGRYELNHGINPTETVNQAVTYFERAIEINPKGNELYQGLVSMSSIQITYDYMMGKDFSERVSRAADYFKGGLEANPNDPLLYIRMAGNYIIQARYHMDRGKFPLNILEQAESLQNKARAINPKSHEIYVQDGEIQLLEARWRAERKQNPRSYFEKAGLSLNRAGALNPKDIRLHLTRARLYWAKAEWKISRRLSAVKELTEGLSSLEKALAINADCAEAYAVKGVLLQLRSRIALNKEIRLTDEKEASASLVKGIVINQNLKFLFEPFLKNF
jgi:serine/threonine-protein kinase